MVLRLIFELQAILMWSPAKSPIFVNIAAGTFKSPRLLIVKVISQSLKKTPPKKQLPTTRLVIGKFL